MYSFQENNNISIESWEKDLILSLKITLKITGLTSFSVTKLKLNLDIIKFMLIHFHYMTCMATPLQRHPCPRGHEIYYFGRPFPGHHFYILSLSQPCPCVEKIYQEKHIYRFTFFTPNLTRLGIGKGGGSWNLQFLVSLPYRCYIPNLVKIGSVVLEKKLTDDARRQTPTHSNRSPEWLRWPKKRQKLNHSTLFPPHIIWYDSQSKVDDF